MTIYLYEFLKSSLVDLHLKPSEENLKQWSDRWPLNIDFFRNINGKPFRFLFAFHTYLAVSDIRLFILFIKYTLSAKYSVFDEYSTWNFRFIIYSSNFIC
ncbi:hypothetical protein Bca4012_050366 [Brassica carinata]